MVSCAVAPRGQVLRPLRHSRILVAGAEALQKLLDGGEGVERHCREIVELEDQADVVTCEVLLAVRKSFITPFERGDIKDLIQSMDDAIDMMHKVVKMVRLFEQTSFEPRMREMGAVIVEAAHLTAEAIPLLEKSVPTSHGSALLPRRSPRSRSAPTGCTTQA